jgi:hypothetical protein
VCFREGLYLLHWLIQGKDVQLGHITTAVSAGKHKSYKSTQNSILLLKSLWLDDRPTNHPTILAKWMGGGGLGCQPYAPRDCCLSVKFVPNLVADRAQWIPMASLFLGLRHCFFFQVAPQLNSRGWVDNRIPLLLRESGSTGNCTNLWICSQWEPLKSNIPLCTSDLRKDNKLGVLETKCWEEFSDLHRESALRKTTWQRASYLHSSLNMFTVLKEAKGIWTKEKARLR